jgi:hypothetical protein
LYCLSFDLGRLVTPLVYSKFFFLSIILIKYTICWWLLCTDYYLNQNLDIQSVEKLWWTWDIVSRKLLAGSWSVHTWFSKITGRFVSFNIELL